MNTLHRGLLRAGLALVCVALGFSTATAEMLKPGDRFPDWALTDQTGARVASSDLAGKTYLLWFYPKAQTPGCTAEGDALRDSFASFEKAKIEILGVSFDEPRANAEFVRAEKFPFRLLSDHDHKLALAVGAAQSSEQPVATRVSYLVDGNGRVLKAYGQVVPSSHAGQVLADLSAPKP
jgi:peroxiredoxin Q/BCP